MVKFSQVMAAATNSKFRGRQLLDHEGLSCLLILLFIDDAKLNTTRLHRILRNLCYHAPTRDWVVRCLLTILEKANVGSSVDQPAGGPSPSGLEASATPTPAKLRKSMSGKEKEAKAEKEAEKRGGSGQNSWLNISMDAALGFRANVFQVTRSGGQGGKKSSSSSASISVHPQAAPVVCRHTLEVLISLAKGFPVHFLPGAPTASASSAQTGDSGEAKKQSKPQEFWETLLKLDRECWTSKKGKSVVRSHSSVSIKVSEEEEASSTSLSFSAFGHLLSMLSSPVIKRSSLLTDKLLRLLSLISLGQPDLLKKDLGALEGGQNSSPQAQLSCVKEEQIQLAVEVLTSKACSEEGLEDVTALLLNLSYGGAQTRESILLLLLAGARQLGNVVSGHVSDLLSELADLKSAGGLAALNKEEEEEGKAKGTLNDRFTKEAVVLVAPTKPKGGGELQLNSMTALTSKTSSQSFFLRVLKVIIQLREAALLAIKKAKKEAEQQQAKKDAEQKKEAEEKKGEEAATKEAKEGQSTAMEVEGAEKELVDTLESLSVQLTLNSLWDTLSNCLKELAETPDHHAVLVLQVRNCILSSTFSHAGSNVIKYFSADCGGVFPCARSCDIERGEEEAKPEGDQEGAALSYRGEGGPAGVRSKQGFHRPGRRPRRLRSCPRHQKVPRICRDTQDGVESDSEAVHDPPGGWTVLCAGRPHQGARLRHQAALLQNRVGEVGRGDQEGGLGGARAQRRSFRGEL